MLTISDPDSLVDSANAPDAPSVPKALRRPSAPSVAPDAGDLRSGSKPHVGSVTTGASSSVPGSIGGCVLRSSNAEPLPDKPVRAVPVRTVPVRAVPKRSESLRAEAGPTGPSGPTGARVLPKVAKASAAVPAGSRADAISAPTPVAAVDPKIARRRAEVRRSAHEVRRRRGLIALSAIGVVLLSGAVLLSPMVGVSAISVSGTEDASRVVTASGIRLGSPLLRVSASDVEARIKAMPEFADVRVTKHWMRKVSIKVVPRVPVAMVVGPTNTILVAENGTAIRSVPSTTTDAYDLPRLDGIPPASVGHALVGDAAALAETAATLGPLARKYTVSISIESGNVMLDVQPPKANSLKPKSKHASAPARASVNVAPGHILVTFGNVQELDLKGRALEAMLASESMDGYRTADLGVPDAPVLGT